MAASNPGYTSCTIKNWSVFRLMLDSRTIWKGSQSTQFPYQISKNGTQQFKHEAEDGGSVGCLKYEIIGQGKKHKLVIAWRNKVDVKKVYTQIFSEDEVVDWVKIKRELQASGPESSNQKDSFLSHIKMNANSAVKPEVSVTLEYKPPEHAVDDDA